MILRKEFDPEALLKLDTVSSFVSFHISLHDLMSVFSVNSLLTKPREEVRKPSCFTFTDM